MKTTKVIINGGELTLTDVHVKCLLAIADNPNVGTFDKLAEITGLDPRTANAAVMALANMRCNGDLELMQLGMTGMYLYDNGFEAVRQITEQEETQANEAQL